MCVCVCARHRPGTVVVTRTAEPGSSVVVQGMGRVLTLPDTGTRVWRGWAALCSLPAGLWLRCCQRLYPTSGGRNGTNCLCSSHYRKAPSAGGACCICSALHLTRSSTLRPPFAVPCLLHRPCVCPDGPCAPCRAVPLLCCSTHHRAVASKAGNPFCPWQGVLI